MTARITQVYPIEPSPQPMYIQVSYDNHGSVTHRQGPPGAGADT
jgi:hypothetical protein